VAFEMNTQAHYTMNQRGKMFILDSYVIPPSQKYFFKIILFLFYFLLAKAGIKKNNCSSAQGSSSSRVEEGNKIKIIKK